MSTPERFQRLPTLVGTSSQTPSTFWEVTFHAMPGGDFCFLLVANVFFQQTVSGAQIDGLTFTCELDGMPGGASGRLPSSSGAASPGRQRRKKAAPKARKAILDTASFEISLASPGDVQTLVIAIPFQGFVTMSSGAHVLRFLWQVLGPNQSVQVAPNEANIRIERL